MIDRARKFGRVSSLVQSHRFGPRSELCRAYVVQNQLFGGEFLQHKVPINRNIPVVCAKMLGLLFQR